MSTTDADLPALPHIPVVEKATVDVLGGKVIVELVAKDMVEALLHNYARAAIEADRARAQPAPSVAVPECRVAVVGFRWDGDRQHHVPQLLIEFAPVPANSPNDTKGWKDRDALAALLAASPQPLTNEKT